MKKLNLTYLQPSFSINKVFRLIWALSIICLIMVGKVYDPRLSIYGFNIILFVNLLPIFFAFYYILYKRKINKKFSFYFLLIILISIYSLILFNYYGYNNIDNYSINKIIFLFLVLTPLIFYKYINGLDKNFYYALFFACSIFFIFGLSRINGDSERMAIFGGGPIVFSRWICIFLILCFNFIKNNILKWVFVCLSLLLIIKSGSKGPFIFLILSILFKYTRAFSFKTFLIGLITFYLIYVSFEFITQLLGTRLSALFSVDILDASSSIGRLDRWRMAILVFLENPSGVGFGNYVPAAKLIEGNDFYIAEYPHNLFLELISELGVFGAGLVFVFIFKIFKILNNSNTKLVEKQLVLFLFLNSMVSGDIMDSRFLFLFLL